MTNQHAPLSASPQRPARRALVAMVVVGAMTLWLGACTMTGQTTMAKPTPVFDLQGHRGARGLRPENTLAAFDHALDVGVTTLELDVGITRDGVPVVGHDPKLNPAIVRDAHGRWLEGTGPAVASLTLAELQRYDVGRIKPDSRYAQTFAQQVPRDGERMPTLAAVFERVKARGANQVRFNIETKINPDEPDTTRDPAGFVRAIVEVVRAHGMTGRVSLQSFDWRTLRESQRQAPEIPTVCLTVRQNWMDNLATGKWTAGITLGEHGGLAPRMVKAAGCGTWSPNFGNLDADGMAEARRLGLKVVPWTVNQPADIERMLDLKPDGLITDYPERARSLIAARGLALPAPLR